MTLSYIIADIRLDIDIPAHLAGLIPAPFAPFRAASEGNEKTAAIRISICPASNSDPSAGETCLAPTKYGEQYPKQSESHPSGRPERHSFGDDKNVFGKVKACLDLNARNAKLLDHTANDLGTVTLYQIPYGYLFTLQSTSGEACLAPTKYPSSSDSPHLVGSKCATNHSPNLARSRHASTSMPEILHLPRARHVSPLQNIGEQYPEQSESHPSGRSEKHLFKDDKNVFGQVEACLDRGSLAATMTATPDFSTAEIVIDPSQAGASAAINSLIRIAFSQMILLHNGISIHASAVVCAGRAILFLGPSGTGKSTHARLWTDTIPATTLLNDDNPIIRIIPSPKPANSIGRGMPRPYKISPSFGTVDTCIAPTKYPPHLVRSMHASTKTAGRNAGIPPGIFAYGSPWSGKTPCYLNSRSPLDAIVRLRQSPENHYTPLTSIDAFINLLPSCSAIKTSPLLHNALLDTLQQIIPLINTGLLRCRPDPEAAFTCHSSLFSGSFGKNIP